MLKRKLKETLITSFCCSATSSKITEEGGTELALDETPPSSQIASFDWDSLVELRLPSDAPFQIKVKVEPYMIACCIVDEGASASIFSACS